MYINHFMTCWEIGEKGRAAIEDFSLRWIVYLKMAKFDLE